MIPGDTAKLLKSNTYSVGGIRQKAEFTPVPTAPIYQEEKPPFHSFSWIVPIRGNGGGGREAGWSSEARD